MGGIVQIDIGAHFASLAHIQLRCYVRGKHHIFSGNADSFRQQQLRIGGTVTAAALFVQQFDDVRIGRCFDRKVFPKALIPRKSGFQCPCVAANAGFVINVKGCGDLCSDLLCLIQCQKRCLLHNLNLSSSSWENKNPMSCGHGEMVGLPQVCASSQP